MSSKSESVSIIPWICLALAKYLRSLSGTYETALTKKIGTRALCLLAKRTGTTLLLLGGVEQVNHDCGVAEQRCETILRPRCNGFPLKEREGPEIFQALWKPIFELSALCHIVVSQVEAVTGLSIGAMSEQ